MQLKKWGHKHWMSNVLTRLKGQAMELLSFTLKNCFNKNRINILFNKIKGF